MEPLGIMLYGYDQEHALMIKASLESVLEQDIVLLSASKREDVEVRDILESEEHDFEDNDPKILMFLGFNEDQIESAMNMFPKIEDMKRPIFCGLTEHNIQWKIDMLLEHLLEEEKYWKKRASE